MGGGWLAGVPASPELLAKVAALPPATETPGVDQSFARAPDPHFTLRKLLRPFAIALIIGLVLDGLDAIASTAMPLLVRGGIDNGVERTALSFGARFHTILLVSVIGLGIVLADWVVNCAADRSWSAATASGCSTRCGSRSSPTCSGSGWTSTSAS